MENLIKSNINEQNKIQATENNENNLEEKEKVFSTYKPEIDQQIGIPFMLEKEEWSKLIPALNSSYGPDNYPEDYKSIETIKSQLNYLKGLLVNKFNDDLSYNLISSEINKLNKQRNLLRKVNDKVGQITKRNENLDKRDSALSDKYSDYNRILYKTTRGFLEFRIEAMENHLDELKTSNLKETQNNDKIAKIKQDIVEL